jgi:hypothetical protein
MYTHFMLEQDCFGPRAQMDHWPLELIAANIRAPSVVLHWPNMRQLLYEIKTGDPKYVAIQVTTPTFERAENMTRAIKERFPHVKVIYGGYPPEQGSADVMIKGEGISQFRQFLGEEPRETTQPTFLLGYKWLGHKVGSESGLLFEKVGCQNGCDFCATSAFHGKKGTYLQSVDQMKQLMAKYLGMGVSNFTIFNEDHLKDKERNDELHKHIKSLDQLVNITGFSCMDSIGQYPIDDLVDLGYYHLWTGVEDFSPHYSKNAYPRVKEFVDTMHEHGILLILSSIVGRHTMKKEDCDAVIDKVMGLGAYANQINILTPFKGAPLYETVKITNHRYKYYDGHHLVNEHPTMSAAQVEKLQLDAQKRDYYELGPSLVRAVDILFNGYRHFKGTQAPRMKKRVESSASGARQSLPLLDLAIAKHPNPVVRERTKALRAEIIEKVGTPEGYALNGKLVHLLGFLESNRIKLEKRFPSWMRQPKFHRVEYNQKAKHPVSYRPPVYATARIATDLRIR